MGISLKKRKQIVIGSSKCLTAKDRTRLKKLLWDVFDSVSHLHRDHDKGEPWGFVETEEELAKTVKYCPTCRVVDIIEKIEKVLGIDE